MRDEPSDWDALVPHVVHPIKVAALEAMRWIDEPFSAVDLDRMHADPPGVRAVAYHLRVLALDLPALRPVNDARWVQRSCCGLLRTGRYASGRSPDGG